MMESKNFGVQRFILSFFVLLAHVFELPGFNFDYGGLCVLIFFIYSGYIISKAINNFYSKKPFAFIVNRFISLLLPFYLVIILTTIFFYALSINEDYLIFKNIIMNLYSWVPIKTLIDQLVNGNNQLELIKVTWSLRIEFLFYFFCFFLIFINSSQFLFKNFKYLSRKKILSIIYIILLFFFNLSFLFIKNFYISTYFGYLVYFFAGYLFYLLDCKVFNIFSTKYINFYKNIIFLIIILNVVYQCPLSLRPLAGYFYQDLYSIILFKVIFVGFFLYFFKTPKFINYSLSIYLGRLSYYIFISHYSIFLIFQKYYDKNTVFILTSIITLLFSMLLFYFCNFLTKNIKNYLRGKKLPF